MSKNLVIVESPAKAKTIEGYLGADFVVRSSYGHIRDLPGGQLAVDVQGGRAGPLVPQVRVPVVQLVEGLCDPHVVPAVAAVAPPPLRTGA